MRRMWWGVMLVLLVVMGNTPPATQAQSNVCFTSDWGVVNGIGFALWDTGSSQLPQGYTASGIPNEGYGSNSFLNGELSGYTVTISSTNVSLVYATYYNNALVGVYSNSSVQFTLGSGINGVWFDRHNYTPFYVTICSPIIPTPTPTDTTVPTITPTPTDTIVPTITPTPTDTTVPTITPTPTATTNPSPIPTVIIGTNIMSTSLDLLNQQQEMWLSASYAPIYVGLASLLLIFGVLSIVREL